ncbi:low molecular weight protein arginine phosphatase [Evansella sp. AB-P1]|uniref:low molecular weight protein arginine phosphatase n=1 Tax=Evansella sp. AB-P1 TaxID=3037653 RepID=UPI00241D29CB|nr:low molecular weight protein arginine phosphatase [Evansella sp. AB-P1]MDG5787324.1 low molecular weight protein arginine phosphatase [Evansella sp. AB-P1]
MTNILFVCTGNTCRSPLAEAIAKHKKSNRNVEVKSAGIHVMNGMPMSEGSKAVLANKGIEQEHQSQLINEELLEWADVILTMTESHKNAIIQRFPKRNDEIFTLKEYIYDDEETKEKLEKIKHHIAQLELKRATFLANNQGKVEEYNENKEISNQEEFEAKLLKEIQPDQEAIDELMSQIPSFDIMDPYGGNYEIYAETLKEIEEAIDKLFEKLDKENN